MTTINLDGVVGWDIEAKAFADQMDSMTGDITFELNSGGGYITDGISILNKIRSYDRGKTTANISYAASMMTQIALACDEVKVYDNGIFMIHNAQGIVMGDHNDMREAADLQERMSEMLAKMYVKKTGMDIAEVRELMDNDTYLFGQEIVDMKFADAIIVTDKEKDKLSAIIVSKLKMEKAGKAMEEEKLSIADLRQCAGNCAMASMPTASDSDKIVKKTQGANMTQEQIEQMQEANKILLANRETLNARIETLLADTTRLSADLDAKKDEIVALQASIESKISEAKAEIVAEAATRVREAIACNVDADIAIAMLNADTAEEASKLALKNKESSGATHQNEIQSKTNLWDGYFGKGQ